ncbi:zinc finger protein 431-like isoform X2 [Cylas formicarius]|uniref:zinc finger protein 431-like isoform X2 n=1 Tax=Cylas formicarius TaxID=197179 RepID=UPI0029586E44|nr:zinc finger protein 431-like isoform X2 [Cylas formicarius]
MKMIENDDRYPKSICPGCHIQLEATKSFLDLVIEGQSKLRNLLRNQELLNREEYKRLQLEKVLHTHNPNATVETYTIQTDSNGEKYIIQIYSEGPLFPADHELSLKAEGLDKPRRKRGRPPKAQKVVPKEDTVNKEILKKDDGVDDSDGRRRRKIKTPFRYDGVVQGEELDNILKKEGVIDEDDISEESSGATQKSEGVIIGREVLKNGDGLGKPIFRNKKLNSKGSRRKFKCNICKKEFLHYGRYELHRKNHKIKYVCKNTECNFESNRKEALVQHQSETGHSDMSIMEEAKSAGGLVILPDDAANAPQPTESNVESPIKCDKCNKTFSCKQNYQVHLKAIHNRVKTFQCTYCNRAFCYANSLKIHTLRHENSNSSGKFKHEYSCDKCEKFFHHPSSLFYHKETVHSKHLFMCSKCDKTFRHRQLLHKHQLVHTDERPFQCTECPLAFKTKPNLFNHQSVHTGMKKYVCPQCGQFFAHKTSLSLHQRWHDGDKPYECEVCHKSFSQKGNLKEHRRIHTGEKPYCCDYCGRSFTTSSQYKLHKKRHTGDKPFRCTHCSRTFLHKDTWNLHLRRHLNIRPFKCKQCPRNFAEAWALKRHERLHLAEKPFKCTQCGKSFGDSSNLTKHKKLHANGVKIRIAAKPLLPDAPPSGELESSEGAAQALEIRQILDDQGNAINFATADGHPIPIVSSNNKIQGLMPDGTLVDIDFLSQNKDTEEQVGLNSDTNLINTDIQFLSENSNVNEGRLNQNGPFLSEDGKVCFITSFNENAFLLT